MEVNVWVTSFVAKKQKMKQSECYKRMIERMKDQKKKTKKMRSKKKNKTSTSYRDRQEKNNIILIIL